VIVRWTAGALADLISVENYQRLRWPHSRVAFDRRLIEVEGRIAEFPLSAPEVKQRPGVCVVAFIDWPIDFSTALRPAPSNVLAIRHTSRQSPFE
jgi:plasmid stabilization system protein ParE